MEKSDAAPDPRLAGIDALIDYASSPDASLVPTPGPLILTREQGTALLLALHRSGVEQAHRLTGAGRPADGDPPLIARPPLTDEEIETIRERLAKDGPQVWHYDEPAAWLDALLEERTRAVGKPSPAPAPLHGVKARMLITDDLLADHKPVPPWADGDPEAVRMLWERASAAAAKWPVGHGKSLLWGGLLDELERAKEPPQLPPSPVVQAALVVEPADPPEKP